MSVPQENDTGDCRARLIQAATEVFFEEGYQASIDRVALRAGVARQTLYNHFPSKAALFGEVVRQATASLLMTLDGEGVGLRERLLRFGAEYRARLLSSAGLGFFRALVAESVRFPDLATSFYTTCSLQTARRLRDVIESAMAGGELRRDDADFAARLFLSMLVGNDRIHYLFSGDPPPEPDPVLAAGIVDAFLRAFAPNPPPSTAFRSSP